MYSSAYPPSTPLVKPYPLYPAKAQAQWWGQYMAPPGVSQPCNLSFFSSGKVSKTPKKTFGDYLSKTSMSIHMTANLLLGCSPWIAKYAPRFQAQLRPLLMSAFSPKATQRLMTLIQDPALLKQKLNQIVRGANLFQYNVGWQVGIHTQQPSKSLGSLVCAVGSGGQMLNSTPKWVSILEPLSYLGTAFWFAGETNDIKNNVDPAHRREWDVRRLGRILMGGSDGHGARDLAGVGKYVMEDCRYVFSLRPWRDFYQALRSRDTDWRVPQAYQTAIGAAFSLMAFGASVLATLVEAKGKAALAKAPKVESSLRRLLTMGKKSPVREATSRLIGDVCRNFGKVMGAGIAIAYVPVLMRAIQNNWKEKENFLTILGVPLTVSWLVLSSSRDISTWKGFFSLGSPMINEGKRLNGKRYREQVNYIQFLYELSLKNPQLKAGDVIAYLASHPDEVTALETHMGKARVDYVMTQLRKGMEAQRLRRVTLTEYLAPMMKGDASL